MSTKSIIAVAVILTAAAAVAVKGAKDLNALVKLRKAKKQVLADDVDAAEVVAAAHPENETAQVVIDNDVNTIAHA